MCTSEEIINFYNSIQACREFKTDKKVSREDMKTILEVGRLSQSSFGLEPWKFLVIEDEEIKKSLYSLAWGMKKESLTGNYLVVILNINGENLSYDSEYVRAMLQEVQGIPDDEIYKVLDRYKIFLEEDFKILNNKDAMTDWSGKQSYIAMNNMVTAAAMLGIDTCPIEGFNRDKLKNYLIQKDLLDEDIYDVACLLSFGYRKDSDKGTKRRKSFNNVVTWVK